MAFTKKMWALWEQEPNQFYSLLYPPEPGITSDAWKAPPKYEHGVKQDCIFSFLFFIFIIWGSSWTLTENRMIIILFSREGMVLWSWISSGCYIQVALISNYCQKEHMHITYSEV